MKILVFNGSPKREKSDTLHITRAFLDGMNDAEKQDITIINVTDKHIEYCKGCFTCKRNGGECVIKDDMKDIIAQIMSSDVLIFSFPLYCYSFPAPLKALIDRTMPVSAMAMRKSGDRYEHVAQYDYSKLKYVMICGCGFPGAKLNFEPAIKQFKLSFPYNHTIITVPESPMFNAPEAESVTKPRLELVRRAGREYAEKGEIEESLSEKITSPMISEDIYVKICNGET